eukprot:scaffold7738_cov107-Isochrysis_galbana.AAC.8
MFDDDQSGEQLARRRQHIEGGAPTPACADADVEGVSRMLPRRRVPAPPSRYSPSQSTLHPNHSLTDPPPMCAGGTECGWPSWLTTSSPSSTRALFARRSSTSATWRTTSRSWHSRLPMRMVEGTARRIYYSRAQSSSPLSICSGLGPRRGAA